MASKGTEIEALLRTATCACPSLYMHVSKLRWGFGDLARLRWGLDDLKPGEAKGVWSKSGMTFAILGECLRESRRPERV